jgi:hypothetical protein
MFDSSVERNIREGSAYELRQLEAIGRFPQMGDSIADAKTEHLLIVD